MSYADYLQSPEWKERARQARQRAGYRCQRCGSKQGPFEVHHRTYTRKGKERPDDLLVLCRICHQSAHDAGAL